LQRDCDAIAMRLRCDCDAITTRENYSKQLRKDGE
jgi:hypothetical protein